MLVESIKSSTLANNLIEKSLSYVSKKVVHKKVRATEDENLGLQFKAKLRANADELISEISRISHLFTALVT